jgi:hypothetical protein
MASPFAAGTAFFVLQERKSSYYSLATTGGHRDAAFSKRQIGK